MRVLLASFSYVAQPYRDKLVALAAHPDIDLCLLAPRSWRHPLGEIPFLPPEPDGAYRARVMPIYLNGRNGKFMFPLGPLLRVLKTEKPDIIHIEVEPLSLAALQLVLLNRLTRRAKVVLFSWENLEFQRGPVRAFVERHNIRQADYLIAGNGQASDRLRGLGGPATHICVMPQIGITPDMNAGIYPFANTAIFTIGFIGRLVGEKGIFTLLEAFSHLPAACRLIVIGDGSAREAFRDRARELHVLSRIELIGAVPHEAVDAYLRKMDVLALPSMTTAFWAEQFGHVLIEAMALGIPVVGSSSGAIPEVIGDAGMIFPEGDAQALGACLLKLMEDAEFRLQLGRRGRERCLKEYTNAKIASETRQIYCKMLAE